MGIVFSGRRLVSSNLGWFKRTRETLGEDAGRERAININAEVIRAWFPDLDPDSAAPIEIRTVHLSGTGKSASAGLLISDERTIRRQGGGKNWRLAGDAIPGNLYDMRVGDLMLMSFDQESNTLTWIILRQGNLPDRPVSPDEGMAYATALTLLGPDRGNMWLIPEATMISVAALLKPIYPLVNRLLMLNKKFLSEWNDAVEKSGFESEPELPRRFVAALLTKRFCILTGLSGSGKTLLARTFVRWICETRNQYALVPVGSNWIGNENIVGYPDALDESKYHRTAALDVMLKALENPDKPHFLILDEMNLSHVERYFADFLSAIESPDEPMFLHGDDSPRSGVPSKLDRFPENLFVIGTVNIDETTYLFSPKVLDRAQVIEFKAPVSAVEGFINKIGTHQSSDIEALGSRYGGLLVSEASDRVASQISNTKAKAIFGAEMLLLSQLLVRHRMEVGFRSVSQVARYFEYNLRFHENLSDSELLELCRVVLDEVILQKFLPKLNGTRSKLGPVLADLIWYSEKQHQYDGYDPDESAASLKTISNAYDLLDGSAQPGESSNDPFLPKSLNKLRQMSRQLDDGFAAFAEA